MKKYILISFYIILCIGILLTGYFEYQIYKSIYHTVTIVGILTININIWYQSTHTKNLHSALKRWLGWK